MIPTWQVVDRRSDDRVRRAPVAVEPRLDVGAAGMLAMGLVTMLVFASTVVPA
jgi:hypothetical protein